MCNATIAEEVMDTGLAARAARRDIHTRMCNNTDVHDSVEAPLDLSLPFCSMWILLRASSYATAAKDARCLVGDIRTEILNKCKRKIRRWYIDELDMPPVQHETNAYRMCLLSRVHAQEPL